MRKAGSAQIREDLLGASGTDNATREIITALDNFVAGNLDERDGLCVAGLKTHRRASGNVEAEAIGGDAVKRKLRVGLDEVVVAADLDGAVALAGDLETDAPTAGVESDGRICLDRDDGAGLLLNVVSGGLGQGEEILRGNGEEAAVEGASEVAVVRANGVVDGYEIGAGGKSALDLDLVESRQDGGLDMAATKHGCAEGHEVRNSVGAITDEFLEVVGDESLGG